MQSGFSASLSHTKLRGSLEAPSLAGGFFFCSRTAHRKAYNAAGCIWALHRNAVVFALRRSKSSPRSETAKVLARQTHSDPSEATQRESVLWSCLQQPDSRFCHSGNAAVCFSFGLSVLPSVSTSHFFTLSFVIRLCAVKENMVKKSQWLNFPDLRI